MQKRVGWMGFLAILCHVLMAVSWAQTKPVCRTRNIAIETGEVCGKVVQPKGSRHQAHAFLGIPFAETTAGENRWKAPQKKTTLGNGIFQATAFGHICPQTNRPGVYPSNLQSEDCLSVNVWTPTDAAPPKRLPVMVFIYGGSFVEGSSQLGVYDGAFIAAEQDVIVVSLNYRLGALGFLAVDDLQGNYGFLDQQMALRWVQDNVKHFGGDPDQVTVFGQSAGAMSVGLHLFSAPGSVELFRAGIMESNPLKAPYKNIDQAKALGRCFQKHKAGCDNVECLRQKSAQQIIEDQNKTDLHPDCIWPSVWHPFKDSLQWAPVIDGQTIKREPAVGFRESPVKPVMMGTNTNEGVLFVESILKGEGNRHDIAKRAEKVLKALFPKDYKFIIDTLEFFENDIERLLSEVVTHEIFTCPNRKLAKKLKAYIYQFNKVSHFNRWKKRYPDCAKKVCHSDELPYVFHTADKLGYAFTANENSLSLKMINDWTTFAKNPYQPVWPQFPEYKMLNTDITTQHDPYKWHCLLWFTD